jgi:hypothetical protein
LDLMRARVALRERSALEIFDLTVRFCAAHARPYAALIAVAVVPWFVVSWSAAALGGWALGWAVAALGSPFAGLPFLLLASKLLFDGEVRVRDVLRESVRIVPRIVLVSLIQLVMLAFGVLLGGVAWLYTFPLVLFLPEVVTLERVRATVGWSRARRLALAHFAAALGTMLVLALVGFGTIAMSDWAGRELLEQGLQTRPPVSLWTAGGNWLALAGWWLAAPLIATLRFFAYIDCRTRGEGWDIQTRFAALAARARRLADDGGAA